MENRQKWVNLAYLAGAGLFGYVAFLLLYKATGYWDLEAKVSNVGLWVQGISFLLAAIFFYIFYASDRSNQYMNEVVAELSRVTWPAVMDTRKMTLAVIALVIIASLILGGIDSLWAWSVTETLAFLPKFFSGLF